VRKLVPCLLVALLLVPSLTTQSLWWDEGISLHLVRLPWREIVQDRADNIHPPLYFFLLKAWTSLAGSSPFAARYLSVLPMVLLPSVVYRFMSKRWGRRVGRTASFLVALSPPFLIYGQEVRAYAFLPVFWLLMLHFAWPDVALSQWPKRAGALAVLDASFILFHYIGFLAVVTVDFLLLCSSLLSKSKTRARILRRIGWLSTAGAALLLLPWLFPTARLGFQGLEGEAGLSNALAEPVSGRFVAALLAVFHGLGLPKALADPGLIRPLVLVGIGLAGGLGCLIRRSYLRRPGFQMIAVWLVPFAAAPVIWSLSPQAHPRYLLPFILPGWLLLGGIAARPEVSRFVRGGVLASTLAMSLLGLRAYFQDPIYARSDVRSVAAYLRRHAQDGDVVLLPHTDWSLPQYELGEANVVMLPHPSEDEKVLSALKTTANPGNHVYLLDYERGALDPRRQVRAYLVSAGYLVDRHQFQGVFLETYVLSQPIETLACDAVNVCLDDAPLCLEGASLSRAPVSGGAAGVRLCWRGATVSALSTGVRLYTPSGALVGSQDDLLIDEQVRPTDLWGGETTSTYHVLPIPVGAPPEAHRLGLGLYETGSPDKGVDWLTEIGPSPSIPLGSVVPAVAPWTQRSPYGLPDPPHEPTVQFDSGLRLLGARIDRDRLYAGQRFFAMVHWSLTETLEESVDPRIELRQLSQTLTRASVGSDLVALPSGRPLVEHVSLRVPASAAPGMASVALVHGDRMVTLSSIEVLPGAHTFTEPSVSNEIRASLPDVGILTGFERNPSGMIRSGEPLTVTLVWQATDRARDNDLTVFTHLVSSAGEIVAQHDGKPGNGKRPTTSWLGGEYITDVHVLRWVKPYEGPSALRIGMYDAKTGQRSLWSDGADHLDLPEDIQVIRETGD
jgi:mannosyltransferase